MLYFVIKKDKNFFCCVCYIIEKDKYGKGVSISILIILIYIKYGLLFFKYF